MGINNTPSCEDGKKPRIMATDNQHDMIISLLLFNYSKTVSNSASVKLIIKL